MSAIIPILSNDKTYGAYRAECSDILGILIALSILWKQYSITQGAITLGCDRLSAIQSIMFNIRERYTALYKDGLLIKTLNLIS